MIQGVFPWIIKNNSKQKPFLVKIFNLYSFLKVKVLFFLTFKKGIRINFFFFFSKKGLLFAYLFLINLVEITPLIMWNHSFLTCCKFALSCLSSLSLCQHWHPGYFHAALHNWSLKLPPVHKYTNHSPLRIWFNQIMME